jgi:hypothetical protein
MAFAVAARRWGWSLLDTSRAMLRNTHSSVLTSIKRYDNADGLPEVLAAAEAILASLPGLPEIPLHPQLGGRRDLQLKLLRSVGVLPTASINPFQRKDAHHDQAIAS